MSGGGGDGPGAPLWIISFADMISNLVIFFILMVTFATASSGSDKMDRKSLTGHVGVMSDGRIPARPGVVRRVPGPGATIAEEGAEAASERRERELREDLMVKVQDASYSVKPEVEKTRDGLRIRLLESTVLVPGSDGISSEAREVITEIGRFFRGEPCELIVEVSTDDRTWRYSRGGSDIDLTRTIAVAVARILHEDAGVPAPRIAVSPLGATRPLESNDTSRGRARNRRIEIVVRSTS